MDHGTRNSSSGLGTAVKQVSIALFASSVLIYATSRLQAGSSPCFTSKDARKSNTIVSVRSSHSCAYVDEFDRENLRSVTRVDLETNLRKIHSQHFLATETNHCKHYEFSGICPWCDILCKCNYRRSVVTIPCGYVDSNLVVQDGAGAIFDNNRSFHIHPFTWKIHGNEPIQTFPVMASGLLSVYPAHFAHFTSEILPGLIFYLHHLPPSVPILVDMRGDSVKTWIALLEELGLASPDRWISWLPSTTYFAHELYFQVAEYSTDAAVSEQTSWQLLRDENPCSWHPSLMGNLVREAFRTDDSTCVEPLVVVLHRAEATTRLVTNQADIMKALKDALPNHRIQEFIGADFALKDAIRLFQRAQVFVAPHGAGLVFMQFLEEGASVVEITFDTNWPGGYYEGKAVGLDLNYYYSKTKGNISTNMTVDVDDLVSVVVRATREAVDILSC